MKDGFGRTIDYIRISLTDKCNLRCVYCMPSEGISYIPHEELLSLEEILRFAGVMANLGIKKIKLTGGEPLVRKNVEFLVGELYKIKGIQDVTLTTNGMLLEEKLDGLYQNGIRRINLSVDSLGDRSYEEITRTSVENIGERTRKVVELCEKYPELRLKINVVPIKGINEDQLIPILKLVEQRNIPVRFIELMPIGLGKSYEILTQQEIMGIIAPYTGELTQVEDKLGNGPAVYFTARNRKAPIGFISAVSHEFCGSCNRIRLTSDGFLKTCLQYDHGISVKEIIRGGCSDEQLKAEVIKAVNDKPISHRFSEEDGFEHKENLGMFQIGG